MSQTFWSKSSYSEEVAEFVMIIVFEQISK